MNLDRLQQVARVWDWLPAFRAAAEYESLQRAGLALGVSPSALSRSIKLLEDALGAAVFVRSPTGLSLTPLGDVLLAATRGAMRRLHDALPESAPNRLRGGAVGPALVRLLCEAAPEIVPGWPLTLLEVTRHEAGDLLRRGDLDVALTHGPLDGAGLSSVALPSLEMVVAGAVNGAVDRVGCVNGDDLAWPQPFVTAPTFDQLVSVAQRLEIAAFLPLRFVPEGWKVFERRPPVAVQFVTREYSSSLPGFLPALRECLARSLTGSG